MGIEGFSDFLARLGYNPSAAEWVSPGSVVLFDAMQLLFRYQCVAADAALDKNWKSTFRTKTEAMRALANSFTEMPKTQVFLEAGVPAMESLGVVPEPAPVWAKVRMHTLRGIARSLADCVASGVVPVLVWDPPIAGGRREEGKVLRTGGMAMLMRSADRTWLYLALKALGVPTYVASMEGERACVAAMMGGAGECMVSSDTDALVLGGGPVLAGKYVPVPGRGLRAEKVCRHGEILSLVKGDQRRLVDTAVFLGCDFVARAKGNGPAAAIARLSKPYYVSEVLSRRDAVGEETALSVERAVRFYEIKEEEAAGCAEGVVGAVRDAELDGPALELLGVPPAEFGPLATAIGGLRVLMTRRIAGELSGGMVPVAKAAGTPAVDEVPVLGCEPEESDMPDF